VVAVLVAVPFAVADVPALKAFIRLAATWFSPGMR
jgi:hypothetical protein